MASQTGSLFLRLSRTTTHNPDRCALLQKFIDRRFVCRSSTLWSTDHFYSSAPGSHKFIDRGLLALSTTVQFPFSAPASQQPIDIGISASWRTAHSHSSAPSSQTLIERSSFSSSPALWRTAHFYSSAPSKMDRSTVGKSALSVPKLPDSDSEKSKKLKNLARILGQDDPDAGLDPETYLLKVLKRQLKTADQSVQKYKVDIKGTFDPFEIVPTMGTSNLTLRRQTEDEEIIIKCILELEEPDDEEYLMEDNEIELNIIQHLKMNIEFRKASLGDKSRFQLLCHYMTQSITIEEIIYLDKSAYIDFDYPYIGPLFSHLNPRMQQCFYDLIKSRGIDTSLADLALDHLSSKYQEEYLNWVRNVRGFLKRKREIEAQQKSVSK